jgi:hypothetical protein
LQEGFECCISSNRFHPNVVCTCPLASSWSTLPTTSGQPCHAWTPSRMCSASDTSLRSLVTQQAQPPTASTPHFQATDGSTSSASAKSYTVGGLEVAGELHVRDGGKGGELHVRDRRRVRPLGRWCATWQERGAVAERARGSGENTC